MSQIVKYVCEELENAEISCVMVNGDPWFKGIDVATVLGYARPRDAVYDHVPLKFKNTFQYLLKTFRIGVSPTPYASELNTSWIREAGREAFEVPKSWMPDANELKTSWICEAGL